jgi:tRNA nucleotidyltransferase/poly(A) polymerase
MTSLKMELEKNQIINDEVFRPLLPKNIYELCIEVSREGFSLTLVGGAVRDWLITGVLPHDLDFELRHTFEYDEKDWSFRVNRLGERLRELYGHQVEFLSFSILRVSWPNSSYEVELGPARIEKYTGQDSYGHSDFQEVLVSNHPYEETFKRRDFTLNAIGIEFGSPGTLDEFTLRDPFDGMEDLRNSILRPCGQDFSKDPVRLCRAIRFSLKYKLAFSPEVEDHFKEFNLQKLTCFYFFREAFKTDFFKFVKLFYKIVADNNLVMTSEIKGLIFLEKLNGENLQLRNEDDVLLFLVYHEDFSERQQLIDHYCEHAKCKTSIFSSHLSFKKVLIELEDFNGESFRKSCEGLPWQEFIERKEIQALKSFHQFVGRVGRDNLSIMGRLNSHLYATFLKVYEVLPTTLKGKSLFEELLANNEIEGKFRGDVCYYAHFTELWSASKS